MITRWWTTTAIRFITFLLFTINTAHVTTSRTGRSTPCRTLVWTTRLTAGCRTSGSTFCRTSHVTPGWTTASRWTGRPTSRTSTARVLPITGVATTANSRQTYSSINKQQHTHMHRFNNRSPSKPDF